MITGRNIRNLCLALMLAVISVSTAQAGSFLPEYTEFTLKNGLKVIVIEDHRLPMVYFRMNVLTGTACDSTRLGLTALTAEILKENTKNYPDGKMSLMIDSVGGTLMVSAERDVCRIDGDFLSRDLVSGLNFLGDMVMNAEFRDEDIRRMRRRIISILAQAVSVHSDALRRELYHRYYGGTGYGAYPYGTPAGLQDIKAEDVRDFYNKNYRPNNVQFVVGGDVDKNKLKKLVKGIFGDWPTGNEICPMTSNVTYPDSLAIFLIDQPGMTATEFLVGRPAVVPGGENYAGLLVLNYILGGGGRISRLYQDLIRDAATCTFVNSTTECSHLGGVFYVHGGAYVESSADAILGMLESMKMLGSVKISVAELQEAKNYFAGSQIRNYASCVNAVANIAVNAVCGQSVEFPEQVIAEIESLTPEKLRDFARGFFDPNKMTIFIAGPSDKLKRPLSDIAPVQSISRGTE
jgi:predicted Zn-dependent peptidase